MMNQSVVIFVLLSLFSLFCGAVMFCKHRRVRGWVGIVSAVLLAGIAVLNIRNVEQQSVPPSVAEQESAQITSDENEAKPPANEISRPVIIGTAILVLVISGFFYALHLSDSSTGDL